MISASKLSFGILENHPDILSHNLLKPTANRAKAKYACYGMKTTSPAD